MVRLIGQPTTEQHNAIRDLIWDGHEGIDWTSEFTAKVSTTRITVLSDKTYHFNPGNESECHALSVFGILRANGSSMMMMSVVELFLAGVPLFLLRHDRAWETC